MAEYRSVSGVARQITKVYRSVSGVAHQLSKAYRGVSGVARQYFSAIMSYLYKKGDHCTSLSGGWLSKYGNKAISSSHSGVSGKPTMVANTDHLLISVPHQSYEYSSDNNMVGVWITQSKIALANYTKLCAEIELTFGDGLFDEDAGQQAWCKLGVYSGQYIDTDYIVKASNTTTSLSTRIGQSLNGVRRTFSIDLSSVTSSCYVAITIERWLEATDNDNSSVELKVYNIWLEQLGGQK